MNARQEILALANMKPTSLKKVSLDTFRAIGKKYTFEDITGIFKHYMPLDNGNKKLVKGILSFSLLPVVTCQQECKGCYDIKSLRYVSVRTKRIVNTILASSPKHIDQLFYLISKQILNSRTITAVRIHVGGDFFSTAYTLQWTKIAENLKFYRPQVNVYTYTKTDHADFLQSAGINVVTSKLADGSYNFGPKEEILATCKSLKGFVCPATLRRTPDQFCGSKCKACQTRQDVFFVLH